MWSNLWVQLLFCKNIEDREYFELNPKDIISKSKQLYNCPKQMNYKEKEE